MIGIFKKKWFRVSSVATALALVAILVVSTFIPSTKLRLDVGGFLSFEAKVGVSVVKAASVVTTLGTASDKSETDPWTPFSSITLATGDFLIYFWAGDNDVSETPVVTWNSITVTQDVYAIQNDVVTAIYSLYIASGATGDVVSDLIDEVEVVAQAATLYKVTGILDPTPLDLSSTQTGSGTTANSGATSTLTQADELIIGAVGVEDEIDDLNGSWTTGAGYVSGNEQQTGTNGAGDASNISIYSAAKIVSATTAQTAEVTGIDNIDWGAIVVTYKQVAGGEADISNTPSSIAFGTVATSTTYWSDGAEPSWPLVDADAYFTLTNNGDTASITIKATDFTGGVGWTLGTPAEDTVRLTAFKEGDGSGAGVTLTTSEQAFISGLSTNIDWELKMETPTILGDGVEKTSTITLTATLD